MKVLYFAPVFNAGGYSHAAQENILSLDEVGVDVVVRHIEMDPKRGFVPRRIKELVQKDLRGVDAIITHNLPDYFVRKENMLNVGLFHLETDHFANATWRHYVPLMDRIIVSCEWNKLAVFNTMGPYFDMTRVHVIGHAVDTSKYEWIDSVLDFGLPSNTFKFYTVAEINHRKNLPALLTAYYSAFDSGDPVCLVVKVSGAGAEETGRVFRQSSDLIKSRLRRFADPARYPKTVLIANYLDETSMARVHKSCDAFVTATHSEGWCIPAWDALACGNLVIAPDSGAFTDYAHQTGIVQVKSYPAPVSNMTFAYEGIYTSDESWYDIDILDLRQKMLEVFRTPGRFLSPQQRKGRVDYVKEHYSRKVIGQKLVKVLS